MSDLSGKWVCLGLLQVDLLPVVEAVSTFSQGVCLLRWEMRSTDRWTNILGL